MPRINEIELKRRSAEAHDLVRRMVIFEKVQRRNETVETFLGLPDFQVVEVPSIGPGDPDVFSQDGRNTIVTVRTQGLSITANGKSVQFMLLYRVEEEHPDHSTLESRSQIVLPAPDGYSVVHCGQNLVPASYQHVFPGKDHEWHDVTDQVQGTYLTWLAIKFDGKGRDDRGNAQLRASLVVPVTLKATA